MEVWRIEKDRSLKFELPNTNTRWHQLKSYYTGGGATSKSEKNTK